MSPREGRSGSVTITVGDEILLGRTVDTNSAWLGRALADLGLRVRRGFSVPDDDAAIGTALARATGEAALVVLTGGLGPTRDDHTREAVSQATGRALSIDPEVLARLERYYRDRDGEMPEIARRVAEVHEGAVVFENPVGTAPGLLLDHEGCSILLLPGVPREMRALFEVARPVLEERLARVRRRVRSREWITTGIPESRLAPRVDDTLEKAGIRTGVEGRRWELAFLPGLRGVDLRATVELEDGEEVELADRLLDRVDEVLAPVIESWRVPAVGGGDLVEALAQVMTATGRVLATAESCTGGLVGKRVTDVPGSSAWYHGGIVAYDDRVKEALLGVPAELLRAHGAVSEAVVRAMVDGVVERFGVDAGIAITGIAGPGGGSEEKPVGTVWYAARVGERVEVRGQCFSGDREAVRERSAQAALDLLFRLVRARGEG